MNAVVRMLCYTVFCRVAACEHVRMNKDYEIILNLRNAVEMWNKLYRSASVFSCHSAC
jgi:hypothetical protein